MDKSEARIYCSRGTRRIPRLSLPLPPISGYTGPIRGRYSGEETSVKSAVKRGNYAIQLRPTRNETRLCRSWTRARQLSIVGSTLGFGCKDEWNGAVDVLSVDCVELDERLKIAENIMDSR